MGQGGEYFSQRGGEEEGMQQPQENPYMDQSAVLRATLNSLAMMNVANVLNAQKRKPLLDEEEKVAQDLKEILRLKKLQNQANGHYNDKEDEDETV